MQGKHVGVGTLYCSISPHLYCIQLTAATALKDICSAQSIYALCAFALKYISGDSACLSLKYVSKGILMPLDGVKQNASNVDLCT